MRTSHIYPFLLLPLALGLQTNSWAQTALPDAGSIRQQIEQQHPLPLPQAAPQPRVAPPPEIRQQTGVSVDVKAFRFVGNTLLSAEQLAPAMANFVNRKLDFVGLQSAADAAAAAYRAAGWIVRVYLPEQDISTGEVTLQVIEAKFAGIRFEGQSPKLVLASEIEAYITAHQAIGQALNANQLDRGLLLADDLPGVSLAGTLVPGQADGETALALQTTDEPFVYGEINLDNTGTRATGSERLTVNLNLNSPGGLGELANLDLLHTRGSDYSHIALTVPDGHNGLRLGINVSEMTYKVIDGPGYNSATPIQGRSGSLGLDLNYPLVRGRLQNLYLYSGLDHKNFYTRDTQVRSDYESNTLRLSLSGNLFDYLGGGGANSATAQILWGRLGNMQAHTLLDSIGREYRKLSYSVTRQQTLTPEHSLFVSLQGQYANELLDSSEKFYIGGAQSVRAYPVSELGGERGQVLTGEWRWRLNSSWVATAFMDHGQVVALPATSSDQQTSRQLRGHGLSATWQGPRGLNIRLTWAHREGTNPQPTQSGTDSDGTLELNRIWFTASMSF